MNDENWMKNILDQVKVEITEEAKKTVMQNMEIKRAMIQKIGGVLIVKIGTKEHLAPFEIDVPKHFGKLMGSDEFKIFD